MKWLYDCDVDFLKIAVKEKKRNQYAMYPKFIIKPSKDLMIRGGDFYAIWLDDAGLWSTDEQDVTNIVDRELDKCYEAHKDDYEGILTREYMWDGDTGVVDKWHKYCQKQMRDSFHMLDEKLIFSNQTPQKKDYASKILPYPIENKPTPAYDELMSVLYSPEERMKIEWAIGSIVSGASKRLQKFVVLYGAAGTGKSTVLNIIQQLFEGYYSVFDAKSLGSASNQFALEAFKTNPLVAIQHDGDLSKIEDNTRLNSLVSHEMMTVNEKHKGLYSNSFKSFLFMGTNKPVKITDGRSGLIRRLIDVSPTGDKVHHMTYNKLVKQIGFELGGIAYNCKEVFESDPTMYDSYIPTTMLGASNEIYNFVRDAYFVFKNEDYISLNQAWEMYKQYCDDANAYQCSRRVFQEELKNYFREFDDRIRDTENARVRNVYRGFKTEKFEDTSIQSDADIPDNEIKFTKRKSMLDKLCAEQPAQYASEKETPKKKWSEVKTKLSDIDTSKLHYVKLPTNHIVIDFDIPDENGKKSFDKNLAEASKWPSTYAELSKSGGGIHLHYIYDGDPSRLQRIYDEHIEVKVFTGNSSLRRKLTKCNGENIAIISSGLPLKGEKDMVNFESFKNEKGLRTLIKKNLNKEIHGDTTSSINFIKKILDEAYESDLVYDVSDLRDPIFQFAARSTNQADYCMSVVPTMKFKSEKESSDSLDNHEKKIIFFDVEVFPNLLLVNWKLQGEKNPVVRMINPTPDEVFELTKFNLVGFNNRRYDNHILYARMLGQSNEQIYKLSQKIIVHKDKNAMFREAYGLSYTDILDFSSKKQSLKKFEIELGIHHQELGLPWDKPVPEKMWTQVAEYCDNDVIATEAVWNARQADWRARQICATLANGSVNESTNSLSTKIIFGGEREPQKQFNYRNMGELHKETDTYDVTYGYDKYICFDKDKKPLFPGYTFEMGKSTYRDEEVGEGGYVYAEPGMYNNIALLDIASMHPSSIINEWLFGPYTQNFKDLVDTRLYIKHGEFDKARKLFNGKLAEYLVDEAAAKELSQALKIVINSVYGLTSASFINPFNDPRNKDNIVAKRGALFMINLKHKVQEMGYTVAHIKTDSIKIPDADSKIIKFVQNFGKLYGYTFEHEATYDRMCLVNNAVYIAKDQSDGHWTATGAEFAVPYVFKSLFSKEDIAFEDLCETKSVTTALYLDMGTDDPEKYRFVGKIGEFCPIKEGCGGGILLRINSAGDKYSAPSGTKGYFWLESEMVKQLNKEDDINLEYYNRLVDDAVEHISKFGDFEMFVKG